jgi:hypothetical protein
MASYEGAMARIRYLRGWGDYRATPATITGGTGPWRIKSYGLTIITPNRRIGSGWAVHPDTSTPTTNRHIRAARMVLEEAGYVHYVTDDDGWWRYAKGEAS